MASTQYLIRRGSRWYYNRAFPTDVWPVLGKAPFRQALKTDSLSEAQRMRPEAERLYWKAVDEARAASASSDTRRPLTRDVAKALSAVQFRRWLDEGEDWLTPARSDGELEKRTIDAANDTAEVRRRLAEGDLAAYVTDAERLLKDAGYASDGGVEFAAFLRLLARADLSRAEVFEGRVLGDYAARPSDLLFAATMGAPLPDLSPPENVEATAPTAAQRTIADLEDAYKADKWEGLSESSKSAYAPIFRLLREVLGERQPLALIDRQKGRELFEVVKRLPANLGKKRELRGLSILAAIEAADRLDLPRLNAKTVNDSYMGGLSAMFAWAVREGWIGANPVEGLRVTEKASARDKRDPFTVGQLNLLFASEPWTLSPGDLPQRHAIRYWAPLIGLFHGLRRGEIAQLKVADVETIEGVPVLQVRGERLKTANAVRTLPVHSELIRLGLLELADQRRRSGREMLFEGSAANSRGQWGDEVGDWFTRRIEALGLKGKRLGLHSLRHNFEDALRRAELHGTAIGAELAGRTKGDPVAAAYGSGFGVSALKEAVEKVTYPGVELPTERQP